MKLFSILFVYCFSSIAAINFIDIVMEEWEDWKLTHRKNYSSSVEEKLRLKIFMENKAKIARHNQKAARGESSFYMKMNHYGDQLHSEVANSMHGYRYDLKNKTQNSIRKIYSASFISPAHVDLPDAVDWRKKGAVTPVKNQGQCGSCWSFSTTGALEGQNFRKTGRLVSLSEQNLIDCSSSYGNHGCQGGLMDFAFHYVKDNGGLDTERSYPYKAQDGNCRFDRNFIGGTSVGYVDLPGGDETKLKEAVATVGPISVAIDASHESLQFYSHGIYSEPECKPTELDHAVLVVGYGQEEGKDYWLVKNSWGTSWGEEGYVKLARNTNNMCGISSSASYPLV